MKTTSVLVAVLSLSAFGKDLADPVNHTGQNVAIKGYDPVAYFEQSRPVMGSAQFTHSYMGATWWFANAADRDKFVQAPEKFAPQFGGYCAYAVSEGHTASIDPEAWKIVDGKLYLNYSKGVQKKWAEDQLRRIDVGNKNWPSLHK